MKALLVCEQREGKLLESSYELQSFASQLGAEASLLLVGDKASIPNLPGKLYLADAKRYGEYRPEIHKQLVLEAVSRENPDMVVFLHSSYGWDLAPHVATALKAAQLSEVVGISDGKFVLPCYNAKMQRIVSAKTTRLVLTIQPGAFPFSGNPSGIPQIEPLDVQPGASRLEFAGYEIAEEKSVDLSKAEVIVSAGRGVGKKDNMPIIEALVKALGGELGATRPVVDAGWIDHSHQVGTTGQVVHPKLYIACGISGSIQHVAGMRQSDFIVAVNKDKEAPIGSVADVLVVADLLQFVPILTAHLEK